MTTSKCHRCFVVLCIPAQVNKIPTPPKVYLIPLIPLHTGHLKCFTHPHTHKRDKRFAVDDVHALNNSLPVYFKRFGDS